jgi:transcriptional regulator with PAS, ATPase and Fis domain
MVVEQPNADGAETTVREEPPGGGAPKRWALKWVWPETRSIRLEGSPLGIGREPAAHLSVSGPRVSRRHAELYRQGPSYVLHDLRSTNGTWLGGNPIEHAPVTAGSVMRVGDWVGVFVLEDESSAEFAELAPDLFGGSELATALAPLRSVARDALPVSLVGATGSGKERFARALHHFSARPGPFLGVNCAALPEQLAEAELFGYRRGAFTGAERASEGYFRAADQGTLFLDEVAELSPTSQSKLLRVLDDGAVLGLGESRPIATNVRIVCASQRPLTELVEAKRFRRDLAARLSGLEVCIPPLSARRADVAPLFARFLAQRSGGRPPKVESRLVEALCLHHWPDNVRELELLTRTLLAMHGHEPTLRREHLPDRIARLVSESAPERPSEEPPRDRREHDLARVQAELARSGGNVRAAARTLGLSRQRIYRLLQDVTNPDSDGARDIGDSDDA